MTTDALISADLTATAPTLEQPVIGQVHALAAAELFFAAWNFEAPTLFAYTNTPTVRTSTPVLATLSSAPPSAQRTSVPY